MMRRALATLLLRACIAVCLLLSQNLAVLHECSHVAEKLGHVEKGPAGQGACIKCIAFASVNGTLGNHIPPSATVQCSSAPLHETNYCFSPLLVVPFQAQAPPALLALSA